MPTFGAGCPAEIAPILLLLAPNFRPTMKVLRILGTAVAAMLVSGLPLSALDTDDIIKMHKAGLSEQTILLAMQNEPGEYDTSSKALIRLKEAGVPDSIIQRTLSPKAPTSPSAPPVPPAQSTAGGADVFWGDYPSIAPEFIDPVPGQDYYLRFTLRQEDNEYPSTNYGRGIVVPINTRVKLLSYSKKNILLQVLETGSELKVVNEEKYTGRSPAGFAKLMLSAVPTPLERLPDQVAAAIRIGEPRRGMTKEQVIMARGYPPVHETTSTESDRWVYWSSRFVKQTIVFVNGRLTEGRGIY